MNIFIKKIILLTLLCISTSVFASIAKVVAFKGEATIIREGKNLTLTKNSTILKHDEIQTMNNTKVQLLFKDNTIISIGARSTFEVFDYLFDEKNKNYKAEFSMFKGTFRTITGKIGKLSPEKFNLKTKSASIGIRGTQIVMNLSKDNEQIFCTEGKISVKKLNTNISKEIKAGEFVEINTNVTKLEVKKIKPSDIMKINKAVSIQNNLAADNITIKKIIFKSNNDENKNDNSNQSNDENKNENQSNNAKQSNDDDDFNKIDDDDLSNITPKSFFKNTNSKATYKGNFNNYSFSENSQYIKKSGASKINIPTSSTIEMKVDFGKNSDQIENGKIKFQENDLKNLDFTGNINTDDATFDLYGKNETEGQGKGTFYGNEAELIKGEVDFKNVENNTLKDYELKGNFEATKQ